MTLILKYSNGNELPQKVQKKVNKFIDKLPTIRRFKPKEDLSKEKVDTQINFTLKCFWIESSLEYKKLSTKEDWDSAMDSAMDSAWASARDSAWDSAWASGEILVKNNKDFKEKYPKWAFKQLFKLRKMGLYPIWVIDWKFIVYVPEVDWKMPKEFETL